MYAKLLRFWTKFKGIYGKLCIRENLYIHILYPVWRISLISPKTYTSLNKNNRHYTDVHFWTLLLKTTLILRKVLFQRHSCRHLNFDPTYENGRQNDFCAISKIGNLEASWPFCGLHQNFSASLRGIYERETRVFLDSNFLQDSITGLGLCHCNELL